MVKCVTGVYIFVLTIKVNFKIHSKLFRLHERQLRSLHAKKTCMYLCMTCSFDLWGITYENNVKATLLNVHIKNFSAHG